MLTIKKTCDTIAKIPKSISEIRFLRKGGNVYEKEIINL